MPFEINVEFPQRDVVEVNAVVNETETKDITVTLNARPIITGVTASVDNNEGIPYVDVTLTGTEIERSFDLAFHNLKGETGEKGEQGEVGNDGISPEAEVTRGTGKSILTVTDARGTTTSDIFDGQDGADGEDGFSPIATITKAGKVTTISITDKSGTTTETVSDGADGADGEDGFSPVANVTKSGDTATITITDKDGTTTETISDGAAGADGERGPSAVVISETEPTDEDVEIWLNPTGDMSGLIDDVKVNGTSVVTNKVANISVPTKTSDLTNDSGYLTLSTLPIWGGSVQ